MKLIIAQKCQDAINEIGKPLTMYMEAQMQKHVPLSLMTIQATAENYHEN
jgi:hypothetical protein